MTMETATRTTQLAHYLEAMGIQRWVRRTAAAAGAEQYDAPSVLTAESPPQTAQPIVSTPIVEKSPESPALSVIAAPPESNKIRETGLNLAVSSLLWPELQQQLRTCQACSLHQNRQQVLIGEGDFQARWLFVADHPDADEDARGQIFPEPPLRLLLDAILHSIGLTRTQIYLTMAVKCYPPNSHSPTLEEQQCCRAYLVREIELIQPQMIIALGHLAIQQILNVQQPLKTLRGQLQFYEKQGIPVMPTYHPQYLLHRPIEKRKVWQDLQQAYHYCQQIKE